MKNTDGEVHMVVSFDLKPGAVLEIGLLKPAKPRWDW